MCSSSYVSHNTAATYLAESTRTLFSAHFLQQKVGDFAAVRLTSARKLDLEILALQGRQNTSVGNSDRYNKVIVKVGRVIISGTSEYFFHYSEVFFVERYVYIMVKPVGTWE